MDKLGPIFRLWQRGFGKLAEAAPQGSVVQKIAQDGEHTSSVLLELFGGNERNDDEAITTTAEVADQDGP